VDICNILYIFNVLCSNIFRIKISKKIVIVYIVLVKQILVIYICKSELHC